ncbi:MAG TPA: Flp family type IVb pilin [Acidimicrobiia bacterium]|nr:Flp family type IVb pilin [Acidimicrobiia bacterium]
MDDAGATMVEYGMMVALIALIAAVGAQAIGPQLLDFFSGLAAWF